MKDQAIPYKIYLQEEELPKAWYNLRADMKNKPAPLLNPATLKPMTADELKPVFCDELVAQELDDTTPYIEIPQEIRDFYKMYRPSPLVRAYCLEEKLQTPAKIYYKFEGNNTSGSHKLNSAIAQAYYAKKQGLKGVTTETGAGQWGTALSMACSYFGLDCKVYMVKVSYEQMASLVFLFTSCFQFCHKHSVTDQFFIFSYNTKVMIHQSHIFTRCGNPVKCVIDLRSDCIFYAHFFSA